MKKRENQTASEETIKFINPSSNIRIGCCFPAFSMKLATLFLPHSCSTKNRAVTSSTLSAFRKIQFYRANGILGSQKALKVGKYAKREKLQCGGAAGESHQVKFPESLMIMKILRQVLSLPEKNLAKTQNSLFHRKNFESFIKTQRQPLEPAWDKKISATKPKLFSWSKIWNANLESKPMNRSPGKSTSTAHDYALIFSGHDGLCLLKAFVKFFHRCRCYDLKFPNNQVGAGKNTNLLSASTKSGLTSSSDFNFLVTPHLMRAQIPFLSFILYSSRAFSQIIYLLFLFKFFAEPLFCFSCVF